MKLTYAIVIEQTPSNYCAYAPDVPGCISTADTAAEMIAMIREALTFHIEELIDGGRFPSRHPRCRSTRPSHTTAGSSPMPMRRCRPSTARPHRRCPLGSRRSRSRSPRAVRPSSQSLAERGERLPRRERSAALGAVQHQRVEPVLHYTRRSAALQLHHAVTGDLEGQHTPSEGLRVGTRIGSDATAGITREHPRHDLLVHDRSRLVVQEAPIRLKCLKLQRQMHQVSGKLSLA